MFATVMALLCLATISQVHAYPLTAQADLQSIETALAEELSDEIAYMQPKAVICQSRNKSPQGVLTLGKLKQMFRTVRGQDAATYIYVPRVRTGTTTEIIYESQGHEIDFHAESIMPILPTAFGLTNTPCNGCAKNLMGWYAKQKKPKILFAHFYVTKLSQSFEADKYIALQCMAKMIHQGFKFGVWDWAGFGTLNDIMDNPVCIRAVADARKRWGFDAYEREMQSVIDRATELSRNPQVESWCK